MSIPADILSRGCAANFPQPVSEEDQRTIDCLVESVHQANCPPLPHIVYRSGSGEQDILRHVFRWDLTPYQEVFQNGLQARRPQQGTLDAVYYNMEQYVHHDGSRPLDCRRPATHAFISTTLNTDWHPSLDDVIGTEIEVYRYEIYAPGGIWVAQTLGDAYENSAAQDEVCFVVGIAPQYIRSAQRFRLTVTASTRSTRRVRVNNILMLNGNFNPQSHPSRPLNIQRPIFDYKDPAIGRNEHLTISIYRPPAISEREKQVSIDSTITNWYAGDVANYKGYINAAFRSSRKNEAYLFMMNEYLLLNYAPGTTDDKVVKGPLFICDGYRSITGTAFAEHGIDCAFGSHYGDEAFIFSGNLCAQIQYTPGRTNDKIIKGPMTITAMFPLFKGTMFESGVDAAFEATNKGEAYLFKDNQYALINYSSDSKLIEVRRITQGFPSLKTTIFESGIDAAFASHRTDEAYIFKGDSYALFDFAPGTTNDYIIGGEVKKILPNWPSLANILPRKNRGLDDHYHAKPDPTCSEPPQKLSGCSHCAIL
ncbi:hypothetical protein RHMOL_Rhmol05G0273400 [Rhododendron molle]|uniref:Uncharacterized protein n=2 Tax=Rhododendron molle TaxID=49168 RepID=A0ACC0NTU2_RHOML|nr:hypothetical protein RHMOL_Rhmol05G0273400 [Rhododendron molle]KAI8556691.1 hypothetical protein RHMOL_Rhmol05G0273400 [Rhododendron molle]